MFELFKRYGWGKYIVVVPSIAIREGVKKSFEITEEHFMEQYGQVVRLYMYRRVLDLRYRFSRIFVSTLQVQVSSSTLL